MNRKKFIYGSLLGVGTAFAVPSYLLSKSKKEQSSPTKIEPNQLDEKLIKDFVIAGHSKLELVKEMLNEHPNLIYTSYDWGNGDYEEAIEGAAHLGNKEIVNYFITQGARPNLFALTMLGKTNLVKPAIETYPELLFAKGAHGLTLLHHAQVGESKELENYFIQKGLTKRILKIR
ncbi:hypothetical protein [Flagellimonas pacifica]|uniref:Ankyrin repeat domain-containing protein n=1 Tax=Flagellimonas pacifica TaxID=1247520 RepID=A0A285MQH4_9FLAO|nr:hypothetical protein [Allomuricauda parva]SNY99439.1 hypothetical protein SAMN06265377_1245 [Allomuricauda parva]